MPKASAVVVVKLTATQQMVVDILSSILIINDKEIQPGTSLREDLGGDSIDMVEIVMGLEDGFDIEITDTEGEKFQTVGDVYAYLEKRGAKP